jgi:DUF2075 family protein
MSRRAYYSAPLIDFLSESADSIIGKIAQNHAQNLEHLQTGAWRQQIEILQRELQHLHSGHILFEALIPRMGRRADVVLIHQDLIFVLEFKVGAKRHLSQDLRQTHGYAVDLSYFHEGSHNKTIIPVLIATEAATTAITCRAIHDHVYDPITSNKHGLGAIVKHCVANIEPSETVSIDAWLNSKYKPTPNIIEAAQALYSNHDVKDIARNDAGAQNLHLTSNRVQEIVHAARINKRKAICFVTGVPGAGKTLVGLNVATDNTSSSQDEHAVFLSGNGPLVEVLREALARDQVKRGETPTKAEALRKVEQIIQNIHHFRDEYLQKTEVPPPEKVVIFDEAQRAWDRHNTSKFMTQKRGQTDFDQSEPEFLISVMNRHQDWCVVVALIGGGQEINTGEAGLNGWIEALARRFNEWDVYFSDKLSQPEYAGGELDFSAINNCHPEPDLHLATSMRSFKAEKLSHMVHYLIHNDPSKANECYQQFKLKFPIRITRDFAQAKAWISSKARGNETKGLIASSGAIRLKPEGIFVKNRIAAADWFLNDADDVRSCHFLEDVATEFDIQGLELDWCLVGWDADYRHVGTNFEHWKFTGTTWKQRHQEEQKRFLENAYRVLLTRARQGMVIFIPHGDDSDSTRPSAFYDATYSYLISCGIEMLGDYPMSEFKTKRC